MIKDNKADIQHFSFEASLDDWERLISLLDRKPITDWVKRDKHLQQYEFRGFRPDHLPWDRVPNLLAQHAQTCEGTRSFLVTSWASSYSEVRKRIKEEISVTAIEVTIVSLLSTLGPNKKNRDLLLWALILDERKEIQEALDGGLKDELINEASLLLGKVTIKVLETELQKANKDNSDLRGDQAKLNAQVASLQAQIQELDKQVEKQREELQEIQSRQEITEQQKETALQEKNKLQSLLEQEQLRNNELQQRVNEQKVSLKVVIAEQHETEVELKRQLDEALQIVEREKVATVELNLSIDTLKQSLKEAEELRIAIRGAYNIEQQKRIEMEEGLRQLSDELYNVQEVLLNKEQDVIKLTDEKRQIQQQLAQSEVDLQEALDMIVEKERELQKSTQILQFDESWDAAIHKIAQHIHVTLATSTSLHHTIQAEDKWNDWQSWQQREGSLVQPLLLLQKPSSASLSDAEFAQQLLVIRWYLLEWLKSSILSALQANSRISG